MKKTYAAALAAITLTLTTGLPAFAKTPPPKPLSGNAILARAAALKGLSAYTVPVDFRVKTHSIIGTTKVAGNVYFKAPLKAALVIEKAPPIIGGFFRGTYDIDLVPQAWPPKYRVHSVSRDTKNGMPVYVLHAVPLGGGDVDSVLFTIATADYAPVAAQWIYHDGSHIDLTFTDKSVDGRPLPATATINVDMPKYKIDASATYGDYDFTTPVDDSVFEQSKH
jgi:hypothetical protein